jgi:broad specificity phosphatase PhoE
MTLKERQIVRKALNYLAHHAIAITALGCSLLALAGASYAAIGLANHSITPVKQDSRYLGGYVRAWASVAADGRVIASAGKPRVTMHEQPVPPGDYDVSWRTSPDSACIAVVNVDARSSGAGYATPETIRRPHRDEQTTVLTYSGLGQPAALPFDIALLCATPR